MSEGCNRLAAGEVELYFYGELVPGERTSFDQHLIICLECRHALEELSIIRRALAQRPAVTAPPRGDWRGFMARLDESLQLERQALDGRVTQPPFARALRPSLRAGSYLAIAALFALVTAATIFVATRDVEGPPTTATISSDVSSTAVPTAAPQSAAEAAFVSLSEQHFDRSKLVVLGLASKDPHRVSQSDWEYERELAASLLSDTRLYRQAAEERGMKTLAEIMGDLELVLLQASLASESDSADLTQIQRLIRKRGLVPMMDAFATTGL
jgi:hypothetical protein